MFLWYGLPHDAAAFPSTTNAPPTTLLEPFFFVGIVTMISALPEQAGGRAFSQTHLRRQSIHDVHQVGLYAGSLCMCRNG
jgi:hypothetical protein